MNLESRRLNGDVAIVTGAASGIGRGVAIKLSLNGAIVACVDINDNENQKTVNLIKEAGGEGFSVHTDIGNSKSVKKMMKHVYDKCGKITILINCAAIVKFSPLETCRDEEWDKIIQINLTGQFYCLREVYPYMKKCGNGRIVQFSSSSAKSGSSYDNPHYTAAKGGVISLSRHAARHWAKDNIRVNTICPGVTDTPMVRQPEASKEVFKKMARNILLDRVAEPEDIAGGVMFLVSDESRYITGITLDVNGGRYIYGN